MDYRKELAKWGYNKGNSIDVEILIDEILPSLFSQQERMYSEEEVIAIVEKSKETGLTAEYLLLTEQFKKK